MSTECLPPDQPCILVIDDDADLVAFLFSVLTEERLSIVAASDGQQALDLLEHGLRPHLILIDLLLPRVSGIDVLNHIRTDPSLKTIPRLVITGSGERDAIVADAIFEKPFDHRELVAAIHRLVGTPGPEQGDDGGFIRPPQRAVADDAPRRARRRASRQPF